MPLLEAATRLHLIGRDAETETVANLIATSTTTGSALLIEGEPGIGKSALLEHAVRAAEDAGHRSLRCTGLPGGAPLGYAGLHELLHPLLPDIGALPPRQRGALLTAFAIDGGSPDRADDGASPDRLLVSLAALGLIEEAAGRGPLVIAVEDLQWLDRSSVHVLDFIGLRLSTLPVLLLSTVRTGVAADALPPLAPPRITLAPLSETDSRALLTEVDGDLSAISRTRILREASGNPLALRELAAALRQHGIGRAALQARLPSTTRLERAFLDQLRPLPARSRSLLVLAAAADGAPVRDVMTAARELGLGVADLAPLEEHGLVTIHDNEVRFRHSLLRSAVQSSAPTGEWIRAHQALAGALSDGERSVWHRAAATLEHDETVAAELEEAGRLARERGAQPEAAHAFERAAALSPRGDQRTRRLVLAAETARSAGMTAEAVELLEQVTPITADPETLTQAALTRITLCLTAGERVPTRAQFDAVLGSLAGPEDTDRRVSILWGAAVMARGRNQPEAERERLRTALEAAHTANPLKVIALALIAPLHQAAVMRDQLPRLVPQLVSHPLGMVSLAIAAESLQNLDTARLCWGLSAERLHESGAAADETQAVRGRANLALLCGRVREGLADAEYAERLAQDTDQPLMGSMAAATTARAHALLGDVAPAEAALRRSTELGRVSPLALITADAHWAAGLIALGQGRFRDALTEFTQMTMHSPRAQWSIADRTEAAVRADQADSVRADVDRAGTAAEAYRSSYLAALVARSRALLAHGDDAAREFEQAIKLGSVSESRLELARTRLLFGEWLRRRRRVMEAREQLAEALNDFDLIGARWLADRAAAELRAAGELPHRPAGQYGPHERLTAQELQIAQLAAQGLSNKEIADRIYLSHRTVGSHLYRVFPKLGIANRSQIGHALTRTGYER